MKKIFITLLFTALCLTGCSKEVEPAIEEDMVQIPDFWFEHMDEAFNFDNCHMYGVFGKDDYEMRTDFYSKEDDYFTKVTVADNYVIMLHVGDTTYLYESVFDAWTQFDEESVTQYVDMLGIGGYVDYSNSVQDFTFDRTEDSFDFFSGNIDDSPFMFKMDRDKVHCVEVETDIATIYIDEEEVDFTLPAAEEIDRVITDEESKYDAYVEAMVALTFYGAPEGTIEHIEPEVVLMEAEGAADED